MLHVIEVRAAEVTEVLVNRIHNLAANYAPGKLIDVPAIEYDHNTAPTLLEQLLSCVWGDNKQTVEKTVWTLEGVTYHVITILENDGNRGVFFIKHNSQAEKNQTEVYFGYNSSMTYNNYLFSALGLSTAAWRFCGKPAQPVIEEGV